MEATETRPPKIEGLDLKKSTGTGWIENVTVMCRVCLGQHIQGEECKQCGKG